MTGRKSVNSAFFFFMSTAWHTFWEPLGVVTRIRPHSQRLGARSWSSGGWEKKYKRERNSFEGNCWWNRNAFELRSPVRFSPTDKRVCHCNKTWFSRRTGRRKIGGYRVSPRAAWAISSSNEIVFSHTFFSTYFSPCPPFFRTRPWSLATVPTVKSENRFPTQLEFSGKKK